MKLVLRRAREARGLLLAAAAAALVATVLVTGLAEYSRQAVDAGQRSVVRNAPAEERSLLVSGAAGRDAAEAANRDSAVRAEFADGLGGVPVTVDRARYGTGQQLTGDLGTVVTDPDDPVFAALTELPELARHAALTAGAWPRPGATPMQVTLPEQTAGLLGLSVGDRVPLTDRSSERRSEVLVTGIWRPHDERAAYWRLAPGVGAGATAATTYGPFVPDPADFAATFAGATVSASWLVEPALGDASPERLAEVERQLAVLSTELPERAGLGSSGRLVTGLDRLSDRLARADLVGRSALLTPLLLVVVLGGYALVLVAALLHTDRRAQTALLRARGAARFQLAGLATREATLVVLPAALLAPLLAGQALPYLGAELPDGLASTPGGSGWSWAVAVAAAVGCLLAMLEPALRGGGTYVADLAARSRPDRASAVARAGLDVALVLLAVLAWLQLRQYAGPLAGAGGGLGIDPLLAAAPTLGVLAAAVIALRLLPPATRLAERFVDRRGWTAVTLGMWQAGRRPHAGPVLLLALAVGGSTLAWSVVTTWERSHVDQADHLVGADLRVIELDGDAPPERAAALAALPGVRHALPGWHDELRIGRDDLAVGAITVDAAGAADVLRLAPGLADETPRALLDRLVAARAAPAGAALPANARRLTGTLRTPVEAPRRRQSIQVTALFVTADGTGHRVSLGDSDSAGTPTPFDVALPAGRGLRLVGFEAAGGTIAGVAYDLRVDRLRMLDAAGAPVPGELLTDRWAVFTGTATQAALATVDPAGGIWGRYVPPRTIGPFSAPFLRFSLLPVTEPAPVPALVTPEVLDALGLAVGDTTPFPLPGVPMEIRVVGTVAAIPATGTAAGGVLLDLPSATGWLLRERGVVRPQPQWWLSVDPARHRAVAEAVTALPGVRLLDRRAEAEAAGRDPYWLGARTGLLAAALGAILLALVGLVVDVWATARHRLAELTVLHTLGATPRLLIRALLTEQGFLAGLGVGVGLLVGAAVGAAMTPLVILTPAADRPVPPAEFVLPWPVVGATAASLLLTALVFGALAAGGVRQRVAAAQLRIGGER